MYVFVDHDNEAVYGPYLTMDDLVGDLTDLTVENGWEDVAQAMRSLSLDQEPVTVESFNFWTSEADLPLFASRLRRAKPTFRSSRVA